MKLLFLLFLIIMKSSLLANDFTPKVKYFLDEKNYLTTENIWQNIDKFKLMDKHNFGFKSSANVWILIQFDNRTNNERSGIVHLPYSSLDYIEVTEYTNNKLSDQYIIGDRVPFENRQIMTNGFAIPYTLKAEQSKDIVLKINTEGALNLKIEFMNMKEFLGSQKSTSLLLGFYYGAVFLMLIYNFILFLTIKDRTYFDYVTFHFVFLLLQLNLNGLGFQYLWPSLPDINIYSISVTMALANYFAIELTLSFLELKKYDIKNL